MRRIDRKPRATLISAAVRDVLPNALSGYVSPVDLESVVADLAPRLIAYATGRTGCRRTAEDIAHDALTVLIARWRRLGPPESPQAFVFAIARRRAVRAVIRRALTTPLDFIMTMRARGGPYESYEQRTELQRVMRAMKQLRAADREVLLLRAAGELSLEEISVVTRSTVPAVKMRLHRARSRLMRVLEEVCDAR